MSRIGMRRPCQPEPGAVPVPPIMGRYYQDLGDVYLVTGYFWEKNPFRTLRDSGDIGE